LECGIVTGICRVPPNLSNKVLGLFFFKYLICFNLRTCLCSKKFGVGFAEFADFLSDDQCVVFGLNTNEIMMKTIGIITVENNLDEYCELINENVLFSNCLFLPWIGVCHRY